MRASDENYFFWSTSILEEGSPQSLLFKQIPQPTFPPKTHLGKAHVADCDIDYSVDPARSESFYAEVRKYWPGLRDGTLEPDYSGCRPKICGPGEAAADFVVWAGREHDPELRGLVNLFGIESPGLTSALAIAELAYAGLDLKER